MIQQRDANEFLADMPESWLDLVILDPPYKTLDEHRKVGTTTRLAHFFSTEPTEYIGEAIELAYGALKDDRHCYLFSDAKNLADSLKAASNADFVLKNILTWDKCSPGMGYSYRRQSEFVVFLAKGSTRSLRPCERKVASKSISDVLRFPRVAGRAKLYPTQKPEALLQLLIEQSTVLGEVVCDPFVGSGATALAALGVKRQFVGCDSSPEAVELATRRIAERGLQ